MKEIIAHSLNELNEGFTFDGDVKILGKNKPGPTILSVTDGTRIMDAVTANSNKEVGDVIHLNGKVNKRQGTLQIEINSVSESEKDFESIIDKNSEPVEREFSIKSEKFERLKPYFREASKKIRKAILNSQPIVIRHHADADGIMSGMAIEEACKKLMTEVGIKVEYNLYRSPSKAPFYEMNDVLKDVSFSKKLLEKNGSSKPLILILDNGSTPEDVLGMKTLKTLGYEVGVIDHHYPVEVENKETSVCKYLSFHINPYIEDFDSSLTAGMLSYETARMIHKDFEKKVYPAVSALGDKSDIEEAKKYIEDSGRSQEEVNRLVVIIDYLAHQLRFESSSEIYREVFENPDFVEVINDEVSKNVDAQLESTMPYLRTQEINGVEFSHIDLEKYSLRSTYPTPGKVLGFIHDKVKSGKENTPVITVGCMSDSIIVRATQPVLPVGNMIERLQKDFPDANVDGGGHDCAGTIRFAKEYMDSVLQNVKEQLKELGQE